MDGYRAARRDRGTGELVEVVIGLEAIAQRFEQLQRFEARVPRHRAGVVGPTGRP
jgi:hypothetical protein